MSRARVLSCWWAGRFVSAPSALLAVGAASLGAVSVEAGASGGTDMLEIRAFNGLYWGDWQGIVIDAAPAMGLEEPVTLSTSHPADAGYPPSRVGKPPARIPRLKSKVFWSFFSKKDCFLPHARAASRIAFAMLTIPFSAVARQRLDQPEILQEHRVRRHDLRRRPPRIDTQQQRHPAPKRLPRPTHRPASAHRPRARPASTPCSGSPARGDRHPSIRAERRGSWRPRSMMNS